jgi:hypothetical protein
MSRRSASGTTAASEVKVPFPNTAFFRSRDFHVLSTPPDSFCNSPTVKAVIMSGQPATSAQSANAEAPSQQNAEPPVFGQLRTPLDTVYGGSHSANTTSVLNANAANLANMESPSRSSGATPSSTPSTNPFLVASKKEVKSPLLDPKILPTSPSAERQPTQGEQEMKPSTNFNAENAITLIVGPEQQKLIVHASYITRTSAFFATALKKEWAEGQTRIVELHEETPEMMAHYLDWVYTSELPPKAAAYSTPRAPKSPPTRCSQSSTCSESADSTPTSATPSSPSLSASD